MLFYPWKQLQDPQQNTFTTKTKYLAPAVLEIAAVGKQWQP